ncbi:iojap-like protein [Anaeromyxobacter sp. K]|uniref:ribosome silencing factor n=1 Tax=Anaeromyxobacter sp. (strain K) TaxID=447217 RepID=UPI00015F9AEF|nr:ribosome silencing factor [Anaeromyxobacter sp. K]ACG71468.1 iojap-like protein [Anaeromyxobacter sp. K]
MATKKKAAGKKPFAKKTPSKRAPARRGPPMKAPGKKKGGPAKAPGKKGAPKERVLRARRPPRAAAPAAAAIEAPAPARPAADRPDPARPTAMAIAAAALDKKAEDVTVLDVRGLTSYADYFVLMTADSDRQASAIADHVEQTMKAQGVTKVGVEGYQGGRWILVDYGDVVAHVMGREARGFYDLEGLWADAPRVAVEA